MFEGKVVAFAERADGYLGDVRHWLRSSEAAGIAASSGGGDVVCTRLLTTHDFNGAAQTAFQFERRDLRVRGDETIVARIWATNRAAL
jgi:hypothetical protein